jgi:CDP-diacylglycerol--glycerol-3-phosphate 3-phosphatidyltransferase
MVLNALDGMMATTFNLKSDVGEILNEVGDIISDVAIYFPLIYITNIQDYVIIIFIILSVINEFCGILAKVVSDKRRYDGPMGKSDRALLLGVICLLWFFNYNINDYLDLIFIIASVLIIISSYLRLSKSLKK